MLKQLTVSDGSSTKPKSNVRISGVGGFLFAVIFALAIGGVGILDMNGVAENYIWFRTIKK